MAADGQGGPGRPVRAVPRLRPPSGDDRVTRAGEGVDDVGEELAAQDLLAEAVLAPGRSLQLVEVPGTSLHGVDDQLITVVIDEDDQFQEATSWVDRDHQPATRVVLVVKGDVSSAHGRPRSERRHRRDGRVGSACGRRSAGHTLRTHSRTAARTASERVARPSASALAVSAARVASSSRTGTTTPGPSPTGGRPRRGLGSRDRS